MEFNMKEATIKDVAFLVEIREEVLREVFSLAPDEDMSIICAANERYYREALARGSHVSCLCYHQDTFVGCGDMCLSDELPSPDNLTGKCGYVMNVYTRPEFRRKGVGSSIVSWLMDYAKKVGVEKITLESSHAGRKLYESHGFRAFKDCMIYARPDVLEAME